MSKLFRLDAHVERGGLKEECHFDQKINVQEARDRYAIRTTRYCDNDHTHTVV